MSTDEEVPKKRCRSFKVKLDQDTPAYGRYNGDSPYQAANKALSEMVRNDVKNGGDPHRIHVFWIIESTKGSGKGSVKPHHQYTGHREDLEEPVTYTVGDTQIIKKHKNVLKKILKADQGELIFKSNRKKTAKVAKSAKVAKGAAKTAKVAKGAAKTAPKTAKVAKTAPKTAKVTKTAKTAPKTTKVAKTAPKTAKTAKVAKTAPKTAKVAAKTAKVAKTAPKTAKAAKKTAKK